MTNLKRHDLSKLFGEMTTHEYGQLRGDIKTRGLLEPILLWQGSIIDGWHRYRACKETGAEPRFTEFEGDDAAALGRVMSLNAYRRHLTETKRISIAKQALGWHTNRALTGRPANQSPGTTFEPAVTDSMLAVASNAGSTTVKRHTAVEAASPRLLAMAERGDIGLKPAAQLVAAGVEPEVLERASPAALAELRRAIEERPVAAIARLGAALRAARSAADLLVKMPMDETDAADLIGLSVEFHLAVRAVDAAINKHRS